MLCVPPTLLPRAAPRERFFFSIVDRRSSSSSSPSPASASESRCFTTRFHRTRTPRPPPPSSAPHTLPHAHTTRPQFFSRARNKRRRRKSKTEFENQKSRRKRGRGRDCENAGGAGKKKVEGWEAHAVPFSPGGGFCLVFVFVVPNQRPGHRGSRERKPGRKEKASFLSTSFSSLSHLPPHSHANRSSLTVSARPSSSVPFLAAMADSAAAVETKRTVP